jgi:uncharacterized membrane protein
VTATVLNLIRLLRQTTALSVSSGAALVLGALILVRTIAAGQTAEPPTDAEILAILKTHCVPCHAAEPTHEAFAKPPAGIMLETVDQIARYAPRIETQVVVERAMPLGNQTGMTDEERARVSAWIESRKK